MGEGSFWNWGWGGVGGRYPFTDYNLICSNNGIGFWTWIWSMGHCRLSQENAGKTQLVLCDQSFNTGAIDVKMDRSVHEEKSSFKMLGLSVSSKLNWDFDINCYCCHVWTGAPSCYLELLDKLQRQICRAVGSSLAASLEPLAHCWNVGS